MLSYKYFAIINDNMVGTTMYTSDGISISSERPNRVDLVDDDASYKLMQQLSDVRVAGSFN